MSDTLFESYISGDDNQYGIPYFVWYGQTFTSPIPHKITGISVYLDRIGTPSGILTASIYVTSGGLPAGSALCSGNIQANTITGLNWYEIVFSSGVNLAAGTQYALVLSAPDCDPSNSVLWRADISSPSYSGGGLVSSNNSGSSWVSDNTVDFLFKEYGIAFGGLFFCMG